MPIIRIDLLPGRTNLQIAQFTQEVTRLAVEVLKCTPETVDVIFTEVSENRWAHAGKLYSSTMENS